MTELYSYDKYKGHHIYVSQVAPRRYTAYIYHNGTCVMETTNPWPVRALVLAEEWVDEQPLQIQEDN